MSEDELKSITESSVEVLRHRFGLGNDRIPEYISEQWDEGSERDYLATFAANGADQVAPVMAFYQDTFIQAGGDLTNVQGDAMEADFRQVAKRAPASPRRW